MNKNSLREHLLQQRNQIDELLNEVPELYRDDLIEHLKGYEQSLIEKEFSKSSQKVYLRVAKRFIKEHSTNDSYLRKEDVIAFKTRLLSQYTSVKTINTYITSINRFLFYCDVGEFKVVKVKSQDESTLADRIYEHEYKHMLRVAKKLKMMHIYYTMRIMGETGVRVDELKAFTKGSIEKTHVSVNNKGKLRKVPVPQKLRYELREFAEGMNTDDEEIIGLSYDQIRDQLKKIAGLCKIKKKKVHPHAFRHYFGFNFAEKKGDVKIAQLADIMGHSSLETTRIYTRGTLQDYLKTVEEI